MDMQPSRRISVCLWLKLTPTPRSTISHSKHQHGSDHGSEASQWCVCIVADQVRGSSAAGLGGARATSSAGAIGGWESRVGLAGKFTLDDLVVFRSLEGRADAGVLTGSVHIGCTFNISQRAERD